MHGLLPVLPMLLVVWVRVSGLKQLIFSGMSYRPGNRAARLQTSNYGKRYWRILEADNGTELYGLPVIGFAVQKYANTTIDGVGGSGAFYSGVSSLRPFAIWKSLTDIRRRVRNVGFRLDYVLLKTGCLTYNPRP